MKQFTLSKKWIFGGVNGLLALLAAVCLLLSCAVRSALPTMDAARTWAGESGEPFVQLGYFLPENTPASEEDVWKFRQAVDSKLTEAALKAPENGSLYTDAYSGGGTLTVTGERGSAEVKVLGVGGDFFRFHPLPLRSGNYLAETDLMLDRVLLDEELAWKLFGGIDLTGMTVTIGTADYYVAGVISREKDRYSTMAYTDGAGMFMAYSTLKACDETAGISCYEIVLPDPITGFGKNLLNENFPVKEGAITDNSHRYSLGNLLNILGDFGIRSMKTSSIVFPYWENAIRLTEDYAALLLVLTVLFALVPTVSAAVWVIRTLRRMLHLAGRSIRNGVSRGIEQRREAKWQAAAGKKDEHGTGTL